MRFNFLSLLMLLTAGNLAMAQTKTITGKVLGQESNPLPGVTVSLKGTKTIVTTNNTGEFSIEVPDKEKAVLGISYVGYYSQEFTVKGKTSYEIVLVPKPNTLDEVVMIGYGTSKKKDLTGAVDKVNIDDVNKAPVRSFEEALGGRVAGVQVVSADGQPGANTSIVIRGSNSITQDNSPLYVVDGFPAEGFNSNAINISEIESIEVLKDASATAIYGARAANGVIIITTKKGRAGKTQINYNVYYGINNIIKKMDVLDPYEFVRYQSEYDSINTASLYLNNGRTLDYYKNAKGINWQDKVFRQSNMINHELSLRGGSGGTTFALSGSAMKQQGIVLNSGYDRYQGRFRLDHKASDNLKVGVNANYSALKSYGNIPSLLSNSSSSTSNLMFSVWGYRPISGDSAVNLLDGLDPAFELDLNDARFNPIETVSFEVRNRFSNVLTANVTFDYKIIKNLTLTSRFGVISQQYRTEEFNGTNTRGGSPKTAPGRVNGVNGSILYNNITNFLNENILNYSLNLKKKHSFDFMAGMTLQSNNQNLYGAAAVNLPNESLGLSGLDEGKATEVRSLRSKNRLSSFFGRTNYNYKSKYYATLTMRADGSSRFSPENKWSFFPSGSIAWRFSKEKFLKKNKIISDAKLRLSWGLTGNNRVSDFAYLSTLVSAPTQSYPFNNVPGATIIPDALGNPFLKWETTAQTNLGLDFNLINDRINVTVDLYRKITYDLLLNAQLPPSSGFTRAFKNIGKVENKGIEFTVTGKVVDSKVFQWNSSFNIAFNRNRVLSLNEGQESLLSQISWDNNWRGLSPYIAKIGQPLGLFYGVIWDGNYQYSDFDLINGKYVLKPTVTSNTTVYDPNIQPGHIKYRDLNGDRIINDDDMTIIGDANPDFTGGFSNNFKYLGFDLNVFFQFSYGNDILNANRLMFEGNSGRRLQNYYTTVLDRWTPDNQNNTMFVAKGDGPRVYSSRIIEDGSYLRLKTIQLGYQLPDKLLSKVKIKSLRVYVAAQNLLTWTNYSGVDPEVSAYNSALTPGFDYSVYPRAKTFTFGLNLSL